MNHISDYLNFILEVTKSNTSQLYYSEKFRSLLKKIESKSEVAKLLLLAERSNQVLTQYTLIDVTDKNDTVSFVQVNRILRKYPEMEIDKELFTKGDYIKMDGVEFWNESRTEMNIGRWSRRTFSETGKSIPDSDIEKFVNLYKATFDGGDEDNSNLQLVSGEDIRQWYLEDNYENRKGQLGASCMRYKSCQKYLDIYVNNPKVCQLLILKSDDGKISGRALIWKLYHHKEGKQFYKGDYYMDRIYTNNDSDKILFQDWAEKRGMRHYGSSYKTDWIMYVSLDNRGSNYYPYMDTFICYDTDNLLLCNDESLWPSDGYIKIQETDGGYISDDVVYSEWHGEYITKDDAIYCKNVSDWLYKGDVKYLEYKDEYAAPTDNVVYSEYHSENFFTDDVVYSEMLNDWLYTKDESVIRVIIGSDDEIDHCVKDRKDLYIEIGGKYYIRKKYIKDPFTGQYGFLKNDGDDLYDKLEKELIDKEKQGLDYSIIVRPIVVEQIRTINREGKFDKEDVIREIESNDIFRKQLRGVYWGVSKDKTPEAEDIIPALFAWCVEKNKFNTNLRVSNLTLSSFTDNIKTFCISDDKIDEELQEKYHIWFGTDSRMIRIISKICDSFDYDLFGKEFYKRYVFLNLP